MQSQIMMTWKDAVKSVNSLSVTPGLEGLGTDLTGLLIYLEIGFPRPFGTCLLYRHFFAT